MIKILESLLILNFNTLNHSHSLSNKINIPSNNIADISRKSFANLNVDYSNIQSNSEKEFYPSETSNEFNFALHMLVNPPTTTVVENHFGLVSDRKINTLIQSYSSTSTDGLDIYTQIPVFINDDEIDVESESVQEDIDEEKGKKDPLTFALSHHDEIEVMYQSLEKVGNWEELGQGVFKKAFVHKDLPGWVIKIPIGCPDDCDNKRIADHKANLESVRPIAKCFDLISLPQSYLYTTSQGDVIIEEMFSFKEFNNNDPRELEALAQFKEFEKASNLGDLHPLVGHNAGILAGSNPPKIGIIDFDLLNKLLFQ